METTTTEAQEAAKKWFETGRLVVLKSIDNMPMDTKADLKAKNEALEEFIKDETFFRSIKLEGPSDPINEQASRQNSAIDAAIDEALDTDTSWVAELTALTDAELRDRYLENRLADRKASGREGVEVTLDDFKKQEPQLVQYAAKLDRNVLERRVTLAHLVQDKGLNVRKLQSDWLNNELAAKPHIRLLANRTVKKAASLRLLSETERKGLFVEECKKLLRDDAARKPQGQGASP